MSWLDNGHCGIVQSPSIDDLEAANFAIMRINIKFNLTNLSTLVYSKPGIVCGFSSVT